MPMNLLAHVGQRSVRLETLVLLRWLAILGQTVAVLVVAFGLGFTMPVTGSLLLIALAAWSNVLLRFRFGARRRLGERWATAVMAFDIVQLGGLLALTGGLENPFAMLIMAPVMVSASALSARRTLALGALAATAITLLAIGSAPVPWYTGEVLRFPPLFVAAVWLALVCSLGFMGMYAHRVSQEARQLADALAATEIVLAREQNLQALDGLAAAAAHALGTPLATISVVARELQKEVDSTSPLADDIALLRSQSERCRDILAKLTTLGDEGAAPLGRMRIAELIEEVVAPFKAFGTEIAVVLCQPDEQPVIARSPGILYGLGNLVENAVDFANGRVTVTAGWTERLLTITVDDDGPGFSADILDRIGEPYVSSRTPMQDGGGGLGLGSFIAKTLLERSGASVEFANRSPPAHGAVVRVEWPRDALELPASAPVASLG